MKKAYKLISALVLLSMVFGAVFAFGGTAFAKFDNEGSGNPDLGISNSVYIVQMIDAPVVAYEGGVRGMRATQPAQGQKINPHNPDVIRYSAYLDSQHDRALRAVGGGQKMYDYRYTYNGFAAVLNKAQAEQMKNVAGVVAVSHDVLHSIDTSSTPAFLGLSDPGGLWNMDSIVTSGFFQLFEILFEELQEIKIKIIDTMKKNFSMF